MSSQGSIQAGADGELKLSGAMSFATVSELLEESKELLESGGGELRIDLKDVTRADSAGVALLVEWVRTLRAADREVSFVNVPPQMLAIARVSGLDQILPLRRG